jgi:hypothetical protein
MIVKTAIQKQWNIVYPSGMNIEYSEGQVYGTRYYTARPQWAGSTGTWSSFSNEAWNEMLSWILETFGPSETDNGTVIPGQRWYVDGNRFWFRENEDLVMFKLRWGV